MKPVVRRLLQIRAGEGRLALLGGGFFFVVQAGQAFAVSGGDALLFARYGVEILPVLFIVLGAATLVATTAYAAVLGRPDRARLSNRSLAVLALIGLPAWAATFVLGRSLYPALWLILALANALIGTLVWVLAGEVCDPRSAKRLFNLFASAGILGTVLAGALTGPAARTFGTESLLLLYAGLGVGGSLLGRSLASEFARRSALATATRTPLAELRTAHRFVWSNPTMRLTAISGVAFSILFFSVTFPFNVEVAAAFPDGAELAGFLGLFGAVVTAATFLVSLLLASRVFARIGVIQALLLLPFAYLAGFGLWVIRLDLITASIVRFGQLVLLGGLASSAYGALFNVVPADHRAQVRAYQSGLPAQTGVMLSGVLILLGQRGLSPTQALGIGITFSILAAALVWRMRSAYGDSLVGALQAGVVEMFTVAESRFASLRQDAQARRVALRGLSDPRPEARRISLGLLAEMGAVEAVDPVAALRTDPSREVREAAVEALVRLSPSSAGAVAEFLDDPEPAVRSAAVRGVGALGGFSDDRLKTLVSDPDPRVRAQAAVAAARTDHRQLGLQVVESLLAQASVEARLAGLRACAEIEGIEASAVLIEAVSAGPVPLRVAAADALGSHPSPPGIEALVGCLDDPEAQIRKAAVQALLRIEDTTERLLAVLETGSTSAQEGAVAALAGRGGAAADALLRWCGQQIREVERLREWRLALGDSPSPEVVAALAGWLARSEWLTTQRILRGLAAAGASESIRLIGRALRSSDPDLRSQAVEALEAVGDRQVARGLIGLLEPEAAAGAASTAAHALDQLTRHARPWFRLAALRARAAWLQAEWRSLVDRVRADEQGIVRQALSRDSAFAVGGDMIETSTTLGIVERVLFLRRVSIFRLLEPEDLERIAARAREQLHAAGEWLCQEGQVGDELYVLVEGSVEVIKGGADGERVLRTLDAGEHFGELAILREQPRSAGVRATTQARTLVLSGAELRAILEERPEVSLAMLESLAERLSTLG